MDMPFRPPVPSTHVDIMGDGYAADPWPALRGLRALGPVVWHETYRRWLVTDYRHVNEVLNDPATYTVEGTSMAALFGADAFISTDDRGRHDALRNVWAGAFRKTMLESLRGAIGGIVGRLLAPVAQRLRAGAAVDVIPAICRPLPTLVIAHMMGVPESMLSELIRWTDAMAAGGPAYHSGPAAQAALAERDAAKAGMAGYLTRLLQERRRAPGDDLISAMASAPAARNETDEQLVQNIRQLIFAGNETTAKWLAHLFVTYAQRPDVQRELRADRTLIRAANEEVLRWQGVTGTLVRRVRGTGLGGASLGGVTLQDGDMVTLLLGAANRDPARWEAPDTFDLHRPPKANFGFGYGLHHCLGLNLARLETEIAIDAALDACPQFVLAAPVVYSTVPARGPSPVVLQAVRS